MSDLKVLWILRRTPTSPDADGMSRWFYNVIKAMRPFVSQMDIIGQHKDENNSYQIWRNYSDHFYSIPIRVQRYRKLRRLLGWDYAQVDTYNSTVLNQIRYWTSEHDYDLVVFLGNGTNVYLPYTKTKFKMIIPLDAPSGVTYAPSISLIDKFKTSTDRLRLKRVEFSYNAANSVLVVSERDREFLIASGVNPKKIFVCPMGVDTVEFSPQTGTIKKEPSILFTGVLSFYPNEDAAIHLVKDIFLRFRMDQDPIKCRIAGRSPSLAVRELGRYPGVEVWENMPDLRRAFDLSMVYVAPMRIGFGMKTKILEAMAMQMPVVGYPLAFNGIADPFKFAMVCDRAEEIVKAVRQLLNNPQLLIDLGKRARQYAIKNHSTDRVARFILDQCMRFEK